jgi:hypothetical protein
VSAPGSQKIITTLVPAMVVNIQKMNHDYTKISYKGFQGWAKTKNLTFYENIFSNIKNKVALSEKIFQDKGKYYLVYYKDGRLNKYNISERIIESYQNIREMESVYPSPDNDLFLIEGIATNDTETRNFQIYRFSSGQSTYLGSFPKNRFNLQGFQFSLDAQYIAFVFLVDDIYLTCLYKADNGELIGYARGAYGINWAGRQFLLNNSKVFWAYDPGSSIPNLDMNYSEDKLFIKASQNWLRDGQIESKIEGEKLYVNAQNGVLEIDLKTRAIAKTPFKSLVFNQTKILNFYVQNSVSYLKNVKKNQSYSEFQGAEPSADFVSFSSSNILARKKYEKIDTLFLYDEEGKEIYRYRSIDEPMAKNENGVLAEAIFEKDVVVIAIESPEKGGDFHFIFQKGQK